MNSQNTISDFEELDGENTLSIDEFFKQLEAREKDLDISPATVIEIDKVDFHEPTDEFSEKTKTVTKPTVTPPVEIETFSPKPFASAEAAPDQNEILTLRAEVSNLQNQLQQKENERVEMFENARRRQNDFETYKKRTERERGETFRNQLSNLAMQMLPVVDNLNRALDLSNAATSEKTLEFRQFFEGIVLVSQQLNEILAEMGVHPIPAVGELFDPHLHEAVATEESEEFPPHTIITEHLRGYQIGDKVIRPSMVKVSKSLQPSGNLPNIKSVLEKNSSESN